MAKIAILVVAHKPVFFMKSKLLAPIQVGSAQAMKRLRGATYYDDQGTNISEKNPNYCELTAIYWAWKNLDADYYGLFHYRRYLTFSDAADEATTKSYATILQNERRLGYGNDDAIIEMIAGYDIVAPRKEIKSKSIYEQYAEDHYQKDLDVCLDYITENYPDMNEALRSIHENAGYAYNMFVMSKGLFTEYCSFLFDVLTHFDRTVDITQYDAYQSRVQGFLAERLTSIYIIYAMTRKDASVLELQTAFFDDASPNQWLAYIKSCLRTAKRRLSPSHSEE